MHFLRTVAFAALALVATAAPLSDNELAVRRNTKMIQMDLIQAVNEQGQTYYTTQETLDHYANATLLPRQGSVYQVVGDTSGICVAQNNGGTINMFNMVFNGSGEYCINLDPPGDAPAINGLRFEVVETPSEDGAEVILFEGRGCGTSNEQQAAFVHENNGSSPAECIDDEPSGGVPLGSFSVNIQ